MRDEREIKKKKNENKSNKFLKKQLINLIHFNKTISCLRPKPKIPKETKSQNRQFP
jgi:hypothetical protein